LPDLAAFADVHACLRALFADLVVNPADVGTVIPADLQQRVTATPTPRPVIRVRRVGGPDDRFTDRPRVDVDVYSSTFSESSGLAERCRQRLISKPARTSAGVIDRAFTEVGPHEVPYTDPDVRLVTATYRVSMRRRTPTA
jgi:hypothetical protein